MNDRTMVGGCYCGFCAMLHGVRTVSVPEDGQASPAARRVRRETYRDWLNSSSRLQWTNVSRRLGERYA
ncbi:MAG: hypothetical protein HY873_12905 [Chloroflexi bacterium]|nr:hypothetical protein [Chloroflexota bacterium]